MAHVRRRNGVWHLIWKDESLRERSLKSPARTKTEAQRFADELERKAWREARGLDEGFVEMLFREVSEKYESAVVQAHSDPRTTRSQIHKHLLPAFGQTQVQHIRAGDVQAWLTSKKHELSPASREKLRIRLQAMIEYARTHLRAFRGDNPAKLVAKVKVPKTKPRFLPAEYVPRIIAAAKEPDLLATAFYTGMRKGELCGLLCENVDLRRREISVSYSYDGTPKDDEPRPVWIPSELMPHLVRALNIAAAAGSKWVFPSPLGGMRTANWDAAAAFRSALCAAGLVRGYELKCVIRRPAGGRANGRARLTPEMVAQIRARAGEGTTALAEAFGVSRRAIRKALDGDSWGPPRAVGCGYTVEVQLKPEGPVACPECGRFMQEKPLPLGFTLKHARSTWGTWAYRATGDIRFVQGGLGHSNVETTIGHYAASLDPHQLEQANKVRYGELARQLPANNSDNKQIDSRQTELVFGDREQEQTDDNTDKHK